MAHGHFFVKLSEAKGSNVENFDLSQYELEETGVLVVQNAKGDDDLIGADGINPVKIVLYGSASSQMIKAQHKAGQQAQLRMQALFRGKVDKKAAEAADDELAAKLVAVTKEIINFPISPSVLYSNPKLGYIKNQVAKYLDDDANFAKPSTTN